ncbi:MAG: peroxiredoxin-like family protein [Desulforhopalus sp.]
MARYENSFAEKSCKLAVIGLGDHTKIDEFKKITGYSGILLTDPSRKAFNLLGFSSSIGGFFGMKTLSRGLSALRQGVRPGSLQGNALQLGGALLLDSDGSVRYLYRSSEAGDDPPVDEMLASLA